MEKEIISTQILKDCIEKHKNYYVFGAGDYAGIVIKFCQKLGCDIIGIVVTDKQGNPDDFVGLAVYELDQIKRSGSDFNLLVAIRNGVNLSDSLFNNITDGDILYCGSELIKSILIESWNSILMNTHMESQLIGDYPSLEPDFVVVADSKNNIPFARMHVTTELEPIEGIIDNCNIDKLRNMYGNIIYMESAKSKGLERKKDDVHIYIAVSHVDKISTERNCPSGYELIQVGAALTPQRIGCITDDVGDNISELNDIYSECTAHYWISKNINNYSYVGLNHYRRQQLIDDDFVEKFINEDVDLVLALPQFTGIPFRNFYLKYSDEIDWLVLEEAIEETRPEYADWLEAFGKGAFYFPCNIMFGKKTVFDEYVDFMMDVTFRIKDIYKERGVVKKKRYMGYLTEILESVYIMKHAKELKVAYTDVQFINK